MGEKKKIRARRSEAEEADSSVVLSHFRVFFLEQARPSPGSRPTPRWAVGLGADADAPTPRAHIYLLSHPQGRATAWLALGYCTFAPLSGAFEFRSPSVRRTALQIGGFPNYSNALFQAKTGAFMRRYLP